MISLFIALKAWFDANGGPNTYLTGGLHEQYANQPAPHVIVQPVTSGVTTTYSGEAFSEPQLQFVVWAVGAANAMTLAFRFIRDLNAATLNTGADQLIDLRRISDPLPAPDSPQPAANGDPLFGFIFTYTSSITPAQE